MQTIKTNKRFNFFFFPFLIFSFFFLQIRRLLIYSGVHCDDYKVSTTTNNDNNDNDNNDKKNNLLFSSILLEYNLLNISKSDFFIEHCDISNCFHVISLNFILNLFNEYFIQYFMAHFDDDGGDEGPLFLYIFGDVLHFDIISICNMFNHLLECHCNNYHDILFMDKLFKSCSNMDDNEVNDKCNKIIINFQRHAQETNNDNDDGGDLTILSTINYLQKLLDSELLIICKITTFHQYISHKLFINITNNDNDNDNKSILNTMRKLKASRLITSNSNNDAINKFVTHVDTKNDHFNKDIIINKICKKFTNKIQTFLEEKMYDTDAINYDLDDNNNNNHNSNIYQYLISISKQKYYRKIINQKKKKTFFSLPQLQFGQACSYWSGMKGDDIYISCASFSNLKEELLDNNICPIPLKLINSEIINAHKLSKTNIAKSLKTQDLGGLNNLYDLPCNISISLSHILSVLIYTNFTKTQYLFKKHGTRYLSDDDTLDDLIKRNKQIGNWYKLFTETVRFYGEPTKTKNVFYTGISQRLLIHTFVPQIWTPISTTDQSHIANQFASDHGIILRLKPMTTGFKDSCFNVKWISNYPHESERVFSEITRLRITGIIDKRISMDENILSVKAFEILDYIIHDESPHFGLQTMLNNKIEKKLILFFKRYIFEKQQEKKNDDDDDNDDNDDNDDDNFYNDDYFDTFYLNKLFQHIIEDKLESSLLYTIKSEFNSLSHSLKSEINTIFNNKNQIQFITPFIIKLKNKTFIKFKKLKMNEWFKIDEIFKYELDNNQQIKFKIELQREYSLGDSVFSVEILYFPSSLSGLISSTLSLSVPEVNYYQNNLFCGKIRKTGTLHTFTCFKSVCISNASSLTYKIAIIFKLS